VCLNFFSLLTAVFLFCVLKTAFILKMCPAHICKNNGIMSCEIFTREGNCVQILQVPVFQICVDWGLTATDVLC